MSGSRGQNSFDDTTAQTVERLTATVERLTATVEQQQAELAALRSIVNGAHRVEPATTSVSEPSTSGTSGTLHERRHLLRNVGAFAAGTIAATAILDASPAVAANGDAILAGLTTTSTSKTTLSYTAGLSNTTFEVNDGASPTLGGGVMIVGAAGGPNRSGVVGYTNQLNGIGVLGLGSGAGTTGLGASGGRANLILYPAGGAPTSRADAHNRGEIIEDSSGDLWCCTTSGTPGTWRKLAGPATAGALHVLTTTKRVYDSRAGQVPFGGIKGKFNSSEQRLIDTTLNSSGVPTGATAALVNLTATNTNSGGFFAAFPNGIAWPGNSSVSWSFLNSTVANLAVVAVDALARFILRCESGGQPGADAVVDVIGYYR